MYLPPSHENFRSLATRRLESKVSQVALSFCEYFLVDYILIRLLFLLEASLGSPKRHTNNDQAQVPAKTGGILSQSIGLSYLRDVLKNIHKHITGQIGKP